MKLESMYHISYFDDFLLAQRASGWKILQTYIRKLHFSLKWIESRFVLMNTVSTCQRNELVISRAPISHACNKL
uniref:Reverse transcriptase n=1 Tax=Romanomermis culicivorax TaxID=13658 RepID=A0A915I542_ROMCU